MIAAPSAQPWPSPDQEQISTFLAALGKDPGAAKVRAFLPKDHPGKADDLGRKGPLELQRMRRWQQEQRGLYLVVGNGGDCDTEITGVPALFVEWDDRPKEWQISAWQELGLPEPSLMVDTAGRSIHAYWVLEEPMHPEQWRPLQRRLLAYAQADQTIDNPSRVMRLPGSWYVTADGAPAGMVQIIHASGRRYLPEQIAACLPEEAPAAPRPAAPPRRATEARGDQADLAEPVPLLKLLPRDLETLALNGAGEGGRDHACFRLAAGALAVADAAAAAGVPVVGSAEELVLQFAAACTPPFPAKEAQKCLRSAERSERTPDPGFAERVDYQRRRSAKGAGRRPEARQRPPEGAAAADGGAPEREPRRPRLTPQQKLRSLRDLAAELLEQKVPFADRLPLLRARGEELEVTLRDQELQRLIWDARRAAAGGTEILSPGDQVDVTPARWLWEGIVMPAALNLLVALPKVGKTSLMLGMLGAWHRGEGSFLGLPLIGPCPPVLIVGTDQPQSDWGRMLIEAGLLEEDGIIRAPLVGLAHAGRPLHLSPEGIEKIATFAARHPGLFVLLDSVAAVTGPLGIDENAAELAEPIRDLMEAVEPHGATVLAIHHASKGRAGESATLASRGSTALPAAASQIVSLARMASGNPGAPPDRRIVVKTDGRAGAPQSLLIERTDAGWISHGSAESVALAQHLQKLEDDLSDRQAEALELVRERWTSGERMESKVLAKALNLSKDGDRIARRTLDQLVRRGLLQSAMEVGIQGRTKWFWPIGAEAAPEAPAGGVRTPSDGDRTPSRGVLSELSDLSFVSYPPEDQSEPPLTRREGKDTSDRKDTKNTPPREGVRRGVLGVSEPPAEAAAPPAAGLPDAEVVEALMNLWRQRPCSAPSTLALALDPTGTRGITGRKVKAWLRLLEVG